MVREFQEHMEVVHRDIAGAFIISSDGLVLLGQNTPGGTDEGLWTIPAGGIEAGETTEAAAIREVLEEAQLDLSGMDLQPLDEDPPTGESQRVLDGKVKRVKMTFYDFQVKLPLPAAEMPVGDGEGFYMVRWVSREELAALPLSAGVERRLRQMGYLE